MLILIALVLLMVFQEIFLISNRKFQMLEVADKKAARLVSIKVAFCLYGSRLTDSIPAYLSGGEYVVNSRSVRKYGVGGLNRINSGVARFAEGGMVGPNQTESNNTSNSTANNVSINITVNANGNGDNKEEKDTKGEGTEGPANELSAKIKICCS